MKKTATTSKGSYTCHLGGETFELPIVQVALDQLHLDLHNPRMRGELGIRKKAPTESDMESAIWSIDDTKALYQQVWADGGLRVPPFVQKTNGHVVIREGNRRIVVLHKCVGRCSAEGRDTQPFSLIDCVMLPEEFTDAQVRHLLVSEHVSQKHDFHSADKAALLYDLHHEDGRTFDEIAVMTRRPVNDVQRTIEAYSELLRRRKHSGTADNERFGHYYELLQKGNNKLREALASTGADPFRKFDALLDQGKITEQRDIRRASKLVGNPQAMKVLLQRSGTLDQAESVKKMGDSVNTLLPMLRRTATALEALKVRAIRGMDDETLKEFTRLKRVVGEVHKKMRPARSQG